MRLAVKPHIGMISSMNSAFFLFCGLFTALCHGMWYNVLATGAVSDVEYIKEEIQSCVEKDSELFYVSHHEPLIDQAVLVVTSEDDKKLVLCAQSDVCHECSLLKVAELQNDENKTILINTAHPILLTVTHSLGEHDQLICRKHVHFGEHGHYLLNILSNDTAECILSTVVSPTNSYIPIYIALSVFAGVTFLWIVVKLLYRKGWLHRFAFCMPTERLVSQDLGTPLAPELDGVRASDIIIPTKPRFRSLDTFRGFNLLVMIFVNYGGGRYWFFHHAAWDGLAVADLVFPWFVFVMGTSIALSFKSQLQRGVSRKRLLLKVIRRSLILFALGLIVINRAKKGREISLSTLRIPGVLQRLAVSYLAVALMEVFFAQPTDIYQLKWWSPIRDIIPFWPEWLVTVSMLLVHICITMLLPVPTCPTGYLGPGGLHDNSSYWNCTGGAAGYIDIWFFGSNHIYQHPTAKVPYLTCQPHDPEGILGCLTSIFLCFLGLQAGKILLYHQDWILCTKRWILWSFVTGLIAGTLCKFSQYDGWIPVNKNLWSVSYIFCTASMAFVLLTVCYLVVDVFNYWSGAPFIYTGMNSIIVYLCSEVFSIYFPAQFSVSNTHMAQLAMAVWGTAIWCFMAAILYHKRIFIAI